MLCEKAVLAQGPVECRSLAAPWSWLSSLSSLDPQLWDTLICPGNGSRLEGLLLAPLLPLIQKVLFSKLIFTIPVQLMTYLQERRCQLCVMHTMDVLIVVFFHSSHIR